MQNKKRNLPKMILIFVLSIIFVLSAAFFIYVSDYYKADNVATSLLSSNNIKTENDMIVLYPDTQTDTAIIFYPGAKVEYFAYLPILEKLRENGITCILLKMPFNMAIFDVNAANKVFDKFPDIKNWYIGGHSMGGAMASSFASKNQDKVKGLVLLGAYIYGDYPEDKSLTIYGTFNSELEKNINYTENIVVIDGGNHAQFGNYGKQKGDPDATISSEQQQNVSVKAIMDFVK